MATNIATTTLQINGDTSLTSTILNTPSPKYVNIDEGFSALDSNFITLRGTGSGAEAFDIDAMPSDFITIESVTLRIRAAFYGGFPSVMLKIVESDGTTELTGDTGNIVPLFSSTYNTKEISIVLAGAIDKATWDDAQLRLDLSNFDETSYGIQGSINAIEIDISYVVAYEESPDGGCVCSGEATVFPYFGIGGATLSGEAEANSALININGAGGSVGGGEAEEFVDDALFGGSVIGGEVIEDVFTYFGSGSTTLDIGTDFPLRASYRYNPDLNIPYVGLTGTVNGDGITTSSIFSIAAPKYIYIDEGLPGDSVYIPLSGTGSGSQSFTLENVPSNFYLMERVVFRVLAQFTQFGSPQLSMQIMAANETTPLTGTTGDIVPLFLTDEFETHEREVGVLGKFSASTWNSAVLKFSMANFDAPMYGVQMFLDTVEVEVIMLPTGSEGVMVLNSTNPAKIGYLYEGSGTIFINGIAGAGAFIGITGEGMEISGEATVLVREFHDRKFLWNTRTRIVLDKPFYFNTGEQSVMTFRILTKCRPSCAPEDECERRTLITITARTVEEVCRKLTERRINQPIAEFDKFSVPSETADIAEDLANGILNDCIELIPQEFCEIPECLQYCVDFDLEQIQEVLTFAAIVLEFTYEPDLENSNSIIISGFSPANYTINIHAENEEGVGGLVSAGEASAVSSRYDYFAGGGIEIDGDISGSVISSAWSYITGVCPEVQGGFASSAITAETSEFYSVWNDTDYLTADDGLVGYSSIDPDKPITETLFLPFNVEIPDGSEILGIAVVLERWATPESLPSDDFIPIFDNEIMLVSDDIESENKAFSNYWPILPIDPPFLDGYVLYGADYDTWGITWTSDDINSSNFGLSIRVESSSLDSLIANIDDVQFEIYYCEADSGRIEIDGSAIQKASAYFADGEGGMDVSGSGKLYSVYQYIATGGFALVGNYGTILDIDEEIGSEIVIGGTIIGDVVSSAWTYVAESGIEIDGDISGSVISSAWSWFGEEGTTITGNGEIVAGYSYDPSGAISIDGGYLSTEEYVANGGITINGEIDTPLTSDLILESDGGIDISGNAILFYGDFGDLETLSEFSVEIQDIEIVFSNISLEKTSFPSDTVNACGCRGLPLVIDLKTNIAKENKFARFLTRNAYSFPTAFSMRYNKPNDSWQSNFHYSGISSVGTGTETWNLMFELSCSSLIGGSELGKSFIKFGLYAIQRINGFDYDTRIFVVFEPSVVCVQNRDLIFEITVDSIFGLATIDPDSSVQNSVLFDNIGLFKTRFWTENPDILFNISEVGTPRPVTRIDLTPTLEF